jgi:hypothetical protein
MIRHARRLWRDHPGTSFAFGHASPRIADYCVASGIFNIKQDVPTECWERFIADTLASMSNSVRYGFAVNLMAPAVETGIRAVQLYRCPPAQWTRYCEEKLGLAVELIDRYGMQEYTLLAHKRA